VSASEKLKALEARIGDGLIPYELEDALPQIVAVVEEAEMTATNFDGIGNYTEPRLRSALAALDEALTQQPTKEAV
jgi:hypothetical protein